MKAKLIKVNDYYYLQELPKKGIGGAMCERTLGDTNGKGEFGKLSKQNCEEEFAKAMGVFDVDRLARELETLDEKTRVHDFKTREKIGFKIGFNKAMELNKDKVFTLEDVLDAWELGASEGLPLTKAKKEKLLKSIQPTEIEVEIEMELHPTNHASGLELTGNEFMDFAISENYKPKLDSSGNLILKKK